MTVETTTTIAGPYPTSGTAKAFPFGFKALSGEEVRVVMERGGKLSDVSSALYRVSLAGQSGTVTFTDAPAAGGMLYILAAPDFRQGVSFSNQAPFLPDSHNEANDRGALRDQQLLAMVRRAPMVPLNAAVFNGLFPKVGEDGSWVFEPAGPGATGPANSTYTTLAGLKSADITNVSAIYDGSTWIFTSGNFSSRADDAVIVKADSTPLTAGAWVRQYEELRPEWFGAVGGDPVRDTAALQAALNLGGAINLGTRDDPALIIDKRIVVSRPGTRMIGNRRIDTTADVFSTEAIRIDGDDSVIDGVVLRNATRKNQPTGYQNWGIAIYAHRCKVINCSVIDFQMCIGVLPTGEFYDNKIVTNYCRVIGAGLGPKNLTSSLGEDRGHGIADFGARTTIIGNTVQAADALYGHNGNGPQIPGTDYNDCCLGIVSERLPGYGDQSGADDASGSIIIGNHVIPSVDGKGRFRRCYSLEGMTHHVFTGNFGRGWTWDGLWIVGSSSHGIVSGNIFVSDTPMDDRTGAAWAPVKAAILIYSLDGVQLGNVIVSNNSVTTRTAHSHGIVIYAAGAQPAHVSVANNRVFAQTSMGSFSAYFAFSGGNGVHFVNNFATGLWSSGFYCDSCSRVTIRGGAVDGTSSDAIVGLHVTNMVIDGVSIANCARGVHAFVGSYLIRNLRLMEIGAQSLITSNAGTTINFENNRYVSGYASTFIDGVNLERVRQNVNFPDFIGSAAISATPVASKDAVTFDVALSYLKPGDRVMPTYSAALNSCVLSASVKAPGVATVNVMNWTAASVTIDAGTLSAAMER